MEVFDLGQEGGGEKGAWVDVLDAPIADLAGSNAVRGGDGDGDGNREQGVVILLGQTLHHLTNGLAQAGVHRVVGTPTGRNSLVFALRHGWEVEDVDLRPWGGEGTVEARELYRWLGIGVVSVNSERERREKRKEEFLGGRGSG